VTGQLFFGDARIAQQAMQQASFQRLVEWNGQSIPLGICGMSQENVPELLEDFYEIVAGKNRQFRRHRLMTTIPIKTFD
jgi:hypothetical protein